MTNTTNAQDLCNRIEHLVEEYISATRAAAQAALNRAFAVGNNGDGRVLAFDDARASVIALAEGRATGGRRDRSAERATLRGGVPDAGRDDDRHWASGRRDGARIESADAAAQACRACP
jgi:hypothetical protein